MKKYILFFLMLSFAAGISFGQDASNDPHQVFFKGNALYEKREYEKAIEEYKKILGSGIESAPLYYNIGNAYFKMGRIGYAILYYKKAQALKPGDSDLRSNLAYAQSLTEDSALQPEAPNRVMWLVKLPFRDINLNSVALILAVSYLMLIAMLIIGMANHNIGRRSTFIFYLTLLVFIFSLAGFSARYYDEVILKRGIVVAKEAECKYEPIDKSTTYYTLKEGQEILILNTRNGWRRIRRLDGKLAWVNKDAVEEID